MSWSSAVRVHVIAPWLLGSGAHAGQLFPSIWKQTNTWCGVLLQCGTACGAELQSVRVVQAQLKVRLCGAVGVFGFVGQSAL